jgi:alkaline phosphatase D
MMKLKTATLVTVSLLLVVGEYASAADKPLSRIAFGSCAKQDKPQPIWDAIVATQPQRFLFIGDNIYADTQRFPDSPKHRGNAWFSRMAS